MSSHREAPEISKDPVADSTDVYAFVSPDRPDTVTLIANYIPLQGPAGGPNFYEFGDDVLYEIHIDNNGDGQADITYQFRFQTRLRDPDTFLYNTGPIRSLGSRELEPPPVLLGDPGQPRRQPRSSARTSPARRATSARCPPRTTPRLADAAVHGLPGGIRVFAGQRAEGFYVDLGSIFDLANLRPFQQLHEQYGMHVFSKPRAGRQRHRGAQRALDRHPGADRAARQAGTGQGPGSRQSVIGVWTTASRQRVRLWDADRGENAGQRPVAPGVAAGQPAGQRGPDPDGAARTCGTRCRRPTTSSSPGTSPTPSWPRCCRALYPGVFPNLAALVKSGAARTDLEAILLTGHPGRHRARLPELHRPDARRTCSGSTWPSRRPRKPNKLGLLGGDLAGFPNGRRVFDDVVTIELRAIAGRDLPAGRQPTFTPGRGGRVVTDGLTAASVPSGYLSHFPYLGVPYSGYDTRRPDRSHDRDRPPGPSRRAP